MSRIALAALAIACGCSDGGGVLPETPPLCGPPYPIYAISKHTMTYVACFDHPYAPNRGRSSDTSVVTVTTNEENILLITGQAPGTAEITIEATASGGAVQRHVHPVVTRLAMDTEITRCDAEPIPGTEEATRLVLDAWGKANADLAEITVTGVAGGVTVLHTFMERMMFSTRAEWSVTAVGGPMPEEAVQCYLTIDWSVHGHPPQVEGT